MKKRVISAILAAMMVIPALAACGGKDSGVIGGADGTADIEVSDNGAPKDEQTPSKKDEAASEEEQVTPTFMYFVSAKDADYDAEMKVVQELRDAYEGKVNFQITNIDENPEAAENFPVAGQTPALIMLDTSNNISALEFTMSDKATLENDIKAALGE